MEDRIINFIIKSLNTDPKKTKMFELGLVDDKGNKLKDPKTIEEKRCFSSLQLLMFKIKRDLGKNVKHFKHINTLKLDNTLKFNYPVKDIKKKFKI